jgi:hypothetical protein
MKEPTAGLSQQAGEAGGSLILEAQGRVTTRSSVGATAPGDAVGSTIVFQ